MGYSCHTKPYFKGKACVWRGTWALSTGLCFPLQSELAVHKQEALDRVLCHAEDGIAFPFVRLQNFPS